MITLLWYLVVAALIAGVVFAVTLVVFGRNEQLSPLPPRTSPSQLPPAGKVGVADVKGLRLGVALRGYRMSDVDWTLDRLGEELELAQGEQERLRDLVVALGGDPTPPPAVVVTDLPSDAAEEDPGAEDEAPVADAGGSDTGDQQVGHDGDPARAVTVPAATSEAGAVDVENDRPQV